MAGRQTACVIRFKAQLNGGADEWSAPLRVDRLREEN